MSRVRAQATRLAHNIGPVGVMIFFIALGIVIYFSIQNRNQADRNGKIGEQVLSLTKSVAALQGQIVTATTISKQGTDRLLDCTTPEGKCSQDQKQQTAAAIDALNKQTAALIADMLKKVGQLARAQGVPQATVDRILGQPVPVPAPFVGMQTAGTPSPAAQATSTVPSPTPSPSFCTGIQLAPLNLARICIPP